MTNIRDVAATAIVAALLSSCAVKLDNAEPARALAREAAPAGIAFEGWRLYNQRCSSCHGKDAGGPAPMPDLLERVAQMGPRRFADTVLSRYDWSASPDQGVAAPIPRMYLRKSPDGVTQVLEMPAWADQPAVAGHVADLYAYLSGRAEGTLATGAPPR